MLNPLSQIVSASVLLAALAAIGGSILEVKPPKGVDFTLQNSPTPQKYLIETMPGGVALLDYNNDGLLDIFLVNGGRIDPMHPENFLRHDPRYWNRLYRQNKDGASPTSPSRRAWQMPAMETMAWAWPSAITTMTVIPIST